ncbi:acyl dehydratase [Tamaricihabitans halophyticus]|uniref:Acyl dehydratase n=1 Tax=Tamaricihabitans halophyticus TaxID=1262583 RepID=A0A4R2QU38_9PSEU|nr:MaoC/PaaZ C-terminal domain-containing protein [Tamaricihabitans halophyticus]TCP53470.1 acyl dehydratase [Tamaricihabitans halophyticus]
MAKALSAVHEIKVGDQAEPRTFGPITRTDIVRYAGASGDFNPIHHDEGFARSAGFPTVFSIGMLQAGLLASYATDWLGARNVRRYRVRFLEQVWPDDELTCSGKVTSIAHDAAGGHVEVELSCARQTGAVAVAATASFLLSS